MLPFILSIAVFNLGIAVGAYTETFRAGALSTPDDPYGVLWKKPPLTFKGKLTTALMRGFWFEEKWADKKLSYCPSGANESMLSYSLRARYRPLP